MTRDVLERILAIRGVTRAALVNGVGETLRVAPQGEGEGLAGGLVISSLATSRVLADLLGEGNLCQTMIDFENGPVLLAPLLPANATVNTTVNATDDAQPGADTSQPTDTGTHVAVLTLEAASALGRVRLGLRKLLPELAEALRTS